MRKESAFSVTLQTMSRRRRTRSSRSRENHRPKQFSPPVQFLRRRWIEAKLFLQAIRKAPPTVQVGIYLSILVIVSMGVNWGYHAYYKPTELFFPVERALHKSPQETWSEYGALFDVHSTDIVAPELLAALAQAEGSGNPVARTYWRLRLTSRNPLEWYQPASSAVGMFQITNGTFQEGKRYCIHNHQVVEDGPWHDLTSCWFNSLYSRVIPGHAMEMTAALLDRQVTRLVGNRAATLQQKQDLAAIIHLCGAGFGRTYVSRNFQLAVHQRCGDHDVRTYLRKIQTLTRQFAFLKTRTQEPEELRAEPRPG